jgi:predicted RND superfamily exporter protein
MSWLESVIGGWVVERRWWVIVVTLVMIGAAAGGLSRLTFDNDTRVFFSERNPQLKAFEALEQTYTKDENVLFVIAPENGDVFTRESLTAVEELTEASWQIPYSTRVDSVTNFQHTRADGDDLIVEDLVREAASLSDRDLERIRSIALSERVLVDRLVSPSGHATGVNVIVLLPGESMEEAPEVGAFAHDLAARLRRDHPGISIHVTGGVMMDNAFAEASQKEMSTLVPAMFLLLIVLIGVALRSVTGTLATLVVIVLSMLTGLSLAGWLGISMTIASVNAPTLILTLAVADSIHILATMLHQMRLGTAKHEAIAESLRVNFQPVFLTSVTTAVGFLSMNLSDAPPFRDLGNIVAMGVLAAFLYSVLLLPALMAVLPVRMKRSADADCAQCGRIADFVVRRRRVVFWGMLALIFLLTIGIPRVELDDNFHTYFDETYEFRRASDFAEANLTGLDSIEYSLESGESGGISDPAYLAVVDRFAAWYEGQEHVVHVSTLADTMKRLNKNMHGDDEAFYRLPEERDLAAQYLLLYEMSLPYGLDLNNRINVDKSASRATVILEQVSAKTVRAIDERARLWLEENAPPSMATSGTGLSVVWSHISLRNSRSMVIAALLALLLISAILTFALRSLRLGLVSLIPNLAPVFMAFGAWGFLVGRVGLGQTVILSMTLGIVVDDTVHFISKYLRASREHRMASPDAVRYTFHTVGTALVITTVVLTAGFAVLSFSSYRMSADMGRLTGLTIVLALALDFLFLPTLLMMTAPSRQAARTFGGPSGRPFASAERLAPGGPLGASVDMDGGTTDRTEPSELPQDLKPSSPRNPRPPSPRGRELP